MPGFKLGFKLWALSLGFEFLAGLSPVVDLQQLAED